MRIFAKLGLTAILAAILLASAVNMASARSISVSSQTIRVTWSRLEFASELVSIRCLVTLEGSFHGRTIAKVVNNLVGAITRATVKEETCTNGRMRTKNLPWHLQYSGFAGALPNITNLELQLTRFRFEIIVSGLCTGDYGAAEDAVVLNKSISVGVVVSVSFHAVKNLIRRIFGSGICPPSGRLVTSAAESAITSLESATRITITLI